MVQMLQMVTLWGQVVQMIRLACICNVYVIFLEQKVTKGTKEENSLYYHQGGEVHRGT
jgi:hypothetical protein